MTVATADLTPSPSYCVSKIKIPDVNGLLLERGRVSVLTWEVPTWDPHPTYLLPTQPFETSLCPRTLVHSSVRSTGLTTSTVFRTRCQTFPELHSVTVPTSSTPCHSYFSSSTFFLNYEVLIVPHPYWTDSSTRSLTSMRCEDGVGPPECSRRHPCRNRVRGGKGEGWVGPSTVLFTPHGHPGKAKSGMEPSLVHVLR